MNEKAFHAMSYGVYIVTSWDNGRPVGLHRQLRGADHGVARDRNGQRQ